MAEKTVSKDAMYPVAVEMAATVLIRIEKKNWADLDRKTYLNTVAECVEALHGVRLK